MTCSNCQQADLRKTWGGYTMSCVHCCARLLRSARPLRHAQEAMLAAIARHDGAPTKAAVLQALKALDARSEQPSLLT